MRLLLLAALAAGALLAGLNVRDLIGLLRHPSEGASRPEQADPMDAVQPADPWTYVVAPGPEGVPDWLRPPWRITSVPNGTGDVIPQHWVNTCTSDDLAPAWAPDMPYLEAVPLAHMRRAFSTQSGPLGPTA